MHLKCYCRNGQNAIQSRIATKGDTDQEEKRMFLHCPFFVDKTGVAYNIWL